jgi:hypothetical protein
MQIGHRVPQLFSEPRNRLRQDHSLFWFRKARLCPPKTYCHRKHRHYRCGELDSLECGDTVAAFTLRFL